MPCNGSHASAPTLLAPALLPSTRVAQARGTMPDICLCARAFQRWIGEAKYSANFCRVLCVDAAAAAAERAAGAAPPAAALARADFCWREAAPRIARMACDLGAGAAECRCGRCCGAAGGALRAPSPAGETPKVFRWSSVSTACMCETSACSASFACLAMRRSRFACSNSFSFVTQAACADRFSCAMSARKSWTSPRRAPSSAAERFDAA
mmetsp:Transcript_68991/g.173777  ORF Transcript_68991/g.173777 Transcript_68991/m.173777 type:complete len:210 (-) Transcript_68991:2490-3119(-)